MTVKEAAQIRLREIERELSRLVQERTEVRQRFLKYKNSTMLESERLATKAEPYQQTPMIDDELSYW